MVQPPKQCRQRSNPAHQCPGRTCAFPLRYRLYTTTAARHTACRRSHRHTAYPRLHLTIPHTAHTHIMATVAAVTPTTRASPLRRASPGTGTAILWRMVTKAKRAAATTTARCTVAAGTGRGRRALECVTLPEVYLLKTESEAVEEEARGWGVALPPSAKATGGYSGQTVGSGHCWLHEGAGRTCRIPAAEPRVCAGRCGGA